MKRNCEWAISIFSVAIFVLLASPWVYMARAQPAGGAEWDKIVAGAKKEKRVVIYGSSSFQEVFYQFQKKYPEVKVTGFFSRGRRVAQRMLAERRGAKYLADIYINGAWTGYGVMYKGRVLDPMPPALILPEVVDQSKWWKGKHHYVDDEGKYLLGFNGVSYMANSYNTNLVNPKEFKSFWDFLNPKWKGKIAILEPTFAPAGPSVSHIYYSPELGPEFLRRLLSEMDVTVSRDSRQIGDWLAAGKYAISMFNVIGRADIDLAKKQGLPVDWWGPEAFKEGVPLSVTSGLVALINRAPHPNAARLAINWLLSREGQMAFQKVTEGNSLRIDIPKDDVPSYARRKKGIKYVNTEQPQYLDMTVIRKLVSDVRRKKRKR